MLGTIQFRSPYKVLVGKPSHRWEDNIKMDLKWDVRVWAGFIWPRDRLFQVP
jgi:hypothetical protein